MEKLSNTGAELKKRVAYKKACNLRYGLNIEIYGLQPSVNQTKRHGRILEHEILIIT